MTERQIENGAKALYELGNTGDPFIDTLWDDAPPDNREEAHDLFLAALDYIREQAKAHLSAVDRDARYSSASLIELDAFLSPPALCLQCGKQMTQFVCAPVWACPDACITPQGVAPKAVAPHRITREQFEAIVKAGTEPLAMLNVYNALYKALRGAGITVEEQP